MAAKSKAWSKAVARAVVTGAASLTAPCKVHAYTTAPDRAGSGGVEVAGNGYAPVSITASNTSYDDAAEHLITTADMTLGTPSASWGTIVALAVKDAAGVFAYVKALATPITPQVGTPAKIPSGTVLVLER